MRVLPIALLAISLSATVPAIAQNMANMPSVNHAASPAKTGKGIGTIKAIDAKAGMLTIQHGAIPGVAWPPMTMAFKARSLTKRRAQVHLEGVRSSRGSFMPRAAVEDNKRMSLRMTQEAKSKLVRAAALRNADLTNFVTQAALREADAVIEASERIKVTDSAYSRVLALLENPPKANAKLKAAIAALPLAL